MTCNLTFIHIHLWVQESLNSLNSLLRHPLLCGKTHLASYMLSHFQPPQLAPRKRRRTTDIGLNLEAVPQVLVFAILSFSQLSVMASMSKHYLYEILVFNTHRSCKTALSYIHNQWPDVRRSASKMFNLIDACMTACSKRG